jgi:uncharacterized protein (TIGR02466 family)
MPIEKWFNTPIYYNRVDNFRQIQKEISDVIFSLETNNLFNKHKDWGNQNHSLSDVTFKKNLIEEYKLVNLKTSILENVAKFLRTFSEENYNFFIKESWLTKTEPKEHAVAHCHAGCDLSGVYYYQAPKNSGSIYFLNPLTNLVANEFFKPDDLVTYPPDNGIIILFPSWLYHGVRSNDSNGVRISLSFNLKLTIN